MDENIRDSFKKVKQDIDFLRQELNLTVNIIQEDRSKISEICNIIYSMNDHNIELNRKIKENALKIQELENFKQNSQSIATIRQINPADNLLNPTDNQPFKPKKADFLPFSTGNEGVPTDRQTDSPTDRQTENTQKIEKKENFNTPQKEKTSFNNVIDTLASLDTLRKELRLKFKRLTDQEVSVFSLMYQLDEELGYSDYKLLSERLNLTESSIRDYVGRLIKKEIPVEKTKINNKLIQLNISSNLKKIASLSAILQLRDL